MVPENIQTKKGKMIEIIQPIPSRDKLERYLANATEQPEFLALVLKLIETHKLPYIVENNLLKDKFSAGDIYLNKFITVDEGTIAMKRDASLISKTDYSVLVTGETGTGKELIAKSMIADRKGAIKAVNCAGFPRELIEAELFGYVKGAFTGADSARDGLMTVAKDGVMFLDEVGELPLDIQAKLLRCIQDKKIRKVGGTKEEDISCKFVFATHRNIKEMVKTNLFRQDLYARISTLELHIKPLRNRIDDIIPITKSIAGGDKFLARYESDLKSDRFDLSLNVRSLEKYIIQYNVLGRVDFV